MREDFLSVLKEIDNFTTTENGAIALKSTKNYLLDAFGSLGAMRDCSVESIIDKFSKAFFYDKKNATRLLFYMRDVRGGQGQRRVFRICLRWLANNYPEYVINNMDNILFFGRGDDYLCLFDTPVEDEMVKGVAKILLEDKKAVENGNYPSMLAKWLPSRNASSYETKYYANKFIERLHVTEKEWRVLLSRLRKSIGIVETLMSQQKWEEIKFDKLPSRASMAYTDAFIRHQQERYTQYLKDLANNETTVNAGALFPVDIVHKVYDKFGCGYYSTNTKSNLGARILYDAMWKALPNYFGDTEETGICVVDTSGSMYGTPMEVAVSLGLYCADKAKGPFKDHFITFSAKPRLQKIVGEDVVEKIHSLDGTAWDMNTNIEAVFELILTTAVSAHLPQEDLPSKLYIISDMQWDYCVVDNDKYSRAELNSIPYYARDAHRCKPETFMTKMEKRFEEAGYKMPNIVYWNVRESECGMFQKTAGDTNCCMVSGYSASLFRDIIAGTEHIEEMNDKGEKVVREKLDPLTVMMKTLGNERYDVVWA